MEIGDPERALAAVEEFREVLNENESVYDREDAEAAESHPTQQVLLRRWLSMPHQLVAGVLRRQLLTSPR